MSKKQKMKDPFSPIRRGKTPIGKAGYDNARENIDPHVRTKVVDTAEMNAFFSGFIRQYKFPVTSDRKFSHYTGASFPTFSEKVSN